MSTDSSRAPTFTCAGCCIQVVVGSVQSLDRLCIDCICIRKAEKNGLTKNQMDWYREQINQRHKRKWLAFYGKA